MKQELYLRLHNRIKNQYLCIIGAYIIYFLICCKFILTKIFSNKKHSNMTVETAEKIVNNVYPHPKNDLSFVNPPINEDLDLSIVITVYNYADGIENNIQSYLNQKTKYNYELIFVNDGSTDKSVEVIEKYVDNKKVKLINRENGGAGAARNTGIDNASGKYLMFVDCDDVIYDNIIEELMNEAYEKDLDIAMCAHNLIKLKDQKIVSVLPSIYSKFNLLGFKNNDKIMNYPGFPWAKVYRRSLLNQIRFPEGYWYEDTLIQFLLFTKCSSFSYLEKICYDYYWYEGNASHIQSNSKNVKSIDCYWLLIDIIKLYIDNNLPIDDRFYVLLLRHVSSFFYGNIRLLDDKTVEALFVLIKQLVLQYKPEKKVKMPYMLKQTEKAILSNNMTLWALASNNQ